VLARLGIYKEEISGDLGMLIGTFLVLRLVAYLVFLNKEKLNHHNEHA